MKRFYSALLALALLLPTLASCKPDSGSTPDESTAGTAALRPIETIVINDACFRVDFDPGDMTLLSSSNTAKDNLLYLRANTMEYTAEHPEGIRAEGFYTVSGETGEGEFLPIPYALPLRGKAEKQSIQQIALSEHFTAVLEGSFWVDNSGRFPTSVKVENLLTAYDADMNMLYSIDPEPLLERRTNPYTGREELAEDFHPSAMYCGENGTLYLVMEYSIIAISSTGEKLYETGEGIYIHNTWQTPDGRILVEYSIPAEGKQIYAYLDDSVNGFSAPVTLPDPGLENYTLYFGDGWDYYFSTAEGVYGMNEEDSAPLLLFRWSSVGINPEKLVVFLAASEYLYYCRYKTAAGAETALLRRPSDAEI